MDEVGEAARLVNETTANETDQKKAVPNLGRPFMVAGSIVLLGAVVAFGLAELEPFDPSQRSALSVALATAAGASSLPAGLLLVNHYRLGGRRSDLDAGLIVLLTSAFWLIPSRVFPVVVPSVRAVSPFIGAGIALTVVWLARSAGSERNFDPTDSTSTAKRLALASGASISFAVALGIIELATPNFDLALAISPFVGALFGVGALIMLMKGYRAGEWALTFIGMDLLALEMGNALATSANDVSSGRWLGASLLALIGASIGAFGALAVAGSAATARRRELLKASLYQIEALQLVSTNEERLHDLRSGLLSVEAFAASLGSDPSVDLLVEEVARLREMVSASRESQAIDISGDLSRIVSARQALGTPIVGSIEEGLVVTGSRPDALEIVQNLVDNAQRHAPGASITLAAQRDGDVVVITVADDGPGISKEFMPRIFDRGFTTGHDGTGLGLHIVRKLAAELGGSVSAHNRPEGGAAIQVSLPVAASLRVHV